MLHPSSRSYSAKFSAEAVSSRNLTADVCSMSFCSKAFPQLTHIRRQPTTAKNEVRDASKMSPWLQSRAESSPPCEPKLKLGTIVAQCLSAELWDRVLAKFQPRLVALKLTSLKPQGLGLGLKMCRGCGLSKAYLFHGRAHDKHIPMTSTKQHGVYCLDELLLGGNPPNHVRQLLIQSVELSGHETVTKLNMN